MQDPSASRSQLSSAGHPPAPTRKLRHHPGVNRLAHEDLHTDPRILRWTAGSDTITDGDVSLRYVFRRMHHLTNFWWGVETADSTNDLTLNVLINSIVQSTATLLATKTESQVILLDYYPDERDVVTLVFSGTPTNVVGPIWAEIEIDEAFQ